MSEYRSMEELEQLIVEWGFNKGILPNPIKGAQFQKTLEEVNELGDAIQGDDREEAKDAIGDIVVTLIMQTRAWDLCLSECVEQAYNIISKRTGKMVGGQFVKDE